MPITLQALADEIGARLRRSPVSECADELCRALNKALTDEAFLAEHLTQRAPGAGPREILYEDPELGFCICGHVYAGEAIGEPHDHGPSWAIYGQASGTTEMTDWRIVETETDDRPAVVRPEKTYEMKPGDAHFYDVGVVHSPKRTAPTRLLRIEGENLENVTRSKFTMAKD